MTLQSKPLGVELRGVDHSISSDHFSILFSLKLSKPKRPRVIKTIRRLGSIDLNQLDDDIGRSFSTLTSASILSDCMENFNREMTLLLDHHAPARTIQFTERDTPWYNREIRHAKTECRRLERKWCQSQLTIHHELFKQQMNHLHHLRESAKKEYIVTKMENANGPKETFAILNNLMHSKKSTPLPSHTDASELAERFATFFYDKTATIRRSIEELPVSSGEPSLAAAADHHSALTEFSPASNEEIAKLLSKCSKSSALDPIPVWIVKQCPSVVPVISDIINQSLRSSVVPP
jgi:hypothetical protein